MRKKFLIVSAILLCVMVSMWIIWKSLHFSLNDLFGPTDSITESVEKGVFYCEYTIKPTYFTFPNKTKLRFVSAWSERGYYIPSGFNKPLEKEEILRIVALVVSDDYKNYKQFRTKYLIWYQDETKRKNSYSLLQQGNPNILYSPNSPYSINNPPPDTITLSLINGDKVTSSDTIGVIQLIKKQSDNTRKNK